MIAGEQTRIGQQKLKGEIIAELIADLHRAPDINRATIFYFKCFIIYINTYINQFVINSYHFNLFIYFNYSDYTVNHLKSFEITFVDALFHQFHSFH